MDERLRKKMEAYKEGIRLYRDRKEQDSYVERIREEIEKVEEGESDEKGVDGLVEGLLDVIRKEKREEEMYRERGEQNDVDYWESEIKRIENMRNGQYGEDRREDLGESLEDV